MKNRGGQWGNGKTGETQVGRRDGADWPVEPHLSKWISLASPCRAETVVDAILGILLVFGALEIITTMINITEKFLHLDENFDGSCIVIF